VIRVITDSASQMPTALAARLGVDVIPVIVTVDGVDFHEGVDLTADEFWRRFEGSELPEVATSQPSPGTIAEHYRTAVAAGATEIVSVHVGSEHSGTLNSARLAATEVDIPVHLVDSGTASFGVACAAWEAATVAASGGSAAEAIARAEATAAQTGTTFIIQALDFARQGGRFSAVLPDGHDGVMVIGGMGGALDVLSTGTSIDELCDQMVAPFLESGRAIRAGVSLADPATLPFTEGIEQRLRDASVEVDIVRYRIGPSIAAHTGPGTAGGFWYPIA
jgi:fatty acid-binding protein DegV